MGKFQTEGPVGVDGFVNFIREVGAPVETNSLGQGFNSAENIGAYLPQGDFIAPHALSETYGAEAGFRFWVNNDGRGTKNTRSLTSEQDGFFYSELKWFIETGFNGGTGTKYTVPFPYNNYLFNRDKSDSANNIYGSGDNKYRILNGRMFHSDVSRFQDATAITNPINVPSTITFDSTKDYSGIANPWVKYTVRTFFLDSFLGMPFPTEFYNLQAPMLKHLFNAQSGEYRKANRSLQVQNIPSGAVGGNISGDVYYLVVNPSSDRAAEGFISVNNYPQMEQVLWSAVYQNWYGQYARFIIQQVYSMVPLFYDFINIREMWLLDTLRELYDQLWLDGPTPADQNAGGDDYYARTRSSVSDEIGRVTVQNSKLKLVNPGVSITDTDDSILIDDQLIESPLGIWGGCYSQTFLKRLDSYPCEVPIYLGAADHGHGYLTLDTDSTCRYFIDKNGSTDFKIRGESTRLISYTSWENVPDDEWVDSVDEWSCEGTAQFQSTSSGAFLKIRSSDGNPSSNDFFKDVSFVPGQPAMIFFSFFYDDVAGIAIYIDDVLIYSDDSTEFSTDYKTFSFVPNQYSHKISITLKNSYTGTIPLYFNNIIVYQAGGLVSSHTSKSDAIEAWKRLHHQEHDYYYNNTSYAKNDILTTSISASASLSNFSHTSSSNDPQIVSQPINFKYTAYITKLDGTSRALAVNDIILNPSSPNLRWRESDGSHINGELYQSNEIDIDKGFWSFVQPIIQRNNGSKEKAVKIFFDENGNHDVANIQIVIFSFNSYIAERDLGIHISYSDLEFPNVVNADDWADIAWREPEDQGDNYGFYQFFIPGNSAEYPEFPDATINKRHYRVRFFAGENSTIEPAYETLGYNHFSIICTKNDDVIRYNYTTSNDISGTGSGSYVSFPVTHQDYKIDYRDYPPTTSSFDQRDGREIPHSSGGLWVYEGDTRLNLQSEVNPALGLMYPDVPGFNVLLTQTNPFENRGVQLQDLYTDPEGSDWRDLLKPGKRLHDNSWLFIQNLRSHGDYSNSRPYNGYPNKSTTHQSSWYELGDLRGPLTLDALSSLSLLRFEPLRVGWLDAEETDNGYGSISGPIYDNLKYIPPKLYDAESESVISPGLKLRLHYLIDLEIEDRIQIERAAYFWEQIIKDDIEIDVLIRPSVSRQTGGTLARAEPTQYNVGPDSFFNDKDRAQIIEMSIFIDTDDIYGNPNSSEDPIGRLPIVDGWLEGANRLCLIMIHEIGHGLGIGTLWNVEVAGVYETEYQFGFANSFGAQYNGPNATREYQSIVNGSTEIYVFDTATSSIQKKNIYSSGVTLYKDYVPVEDGTIEEEFANWQEKNLTGGHPSEFAKKSLVNGSIQTQPAVIELMTPVYDVSNSAISRLTLGYLEDLGYTVDYSQAIDINFPLIGYTATEYLMDKYYKLDSAEQAQYNYDVSQYIFENRDSVYDSNAVRCNCKNHATKNTILPK